MRNEKNRVQANQKGNKKSYKLKRGDAPPELQHMEHNN